MKFLASARFLSPVFVVLSLVVMREANASELCMANGGVYPFGSSLVYRGIFKGEAVAIVRASVGQQRNLSSNEKLTPLSAKRAILQLLGEVKPSDRQPEQYFEFSGFETHSVSCSGTPYVVYVQPLSRISRVSRQGEGSSSNAADFAKRALDDELKLEEVTQFPNILKGGNSQRF